MAQPKIVKRDKFHVTGLSGDGAKTSELWGEFTALYEQHPFKKVNADAYEIRFWGCEKSPAAGKDVHVGFLSAEPVDGFLSITLPVTEYAVFDVYVAQGYESGDAAMEKWLADNASQYKSMALDGLGLILFCYNEKFKDGNQSDSIVELWLPIIKI
ncbi:MAG: GyrI-like domain-containing protein [Oscillospiraceae bacterium]|nr:GyrI-like domain-containing protein [Oscillospiraceae bacterium]